MSLKHLSLGSVAAAANGITISGGTNATPIVATLGAGHGLKDGDRIRIQGVTGLTAMNGTWTLKFTGANTAELVGSVGNGVFGGTASVAVVCDKTPFMEDHSAVVHLGNTPGAAVFVGTAVIEGCDEDTLTTWVDAVDELANAVPAATAGIGIMREVKLHRYMRLRASAYTSGAANASLMA